MYKNGGPIIMVQIENEYAGYGDRFKPGNLDPEFLGWLAQTVRDTGCEELLFTSDFGLDLAKYEIPGYGAALEDALWTVNFKDSPELYFGELEKIQPDGPLMVMEWWTGWFDYWGEEHHGWSNEDFELNLGKIIGDYGQGVFFD